MAVSPKNVGKIRIPTKQHKPIVMYKIEVRTDQGLHNLISNPRPVNVNVIVHIVLSIALFSSPMLPVVK